MLKTIPFNRLLVYLFLVSILPLLYLLFSFFSTTSHLDELNARLERLQDQTFITEKKQALNLAVREHFREADHFYIDKYLETLLLLEPEAQMLQNLSKDKNFADDERIKKRLEYLTTHANTLNFSEGVVQTHPFFQEVTETLVHPVEVNSADIQKILAKIEGIQIGEYAPGPSRPQLIITDFQLDKKKVMDQNEVYLLNMKLIKREFL